MADGGEVPAPGLTALPGIAPHVLRQALTRPGLRSMLRRTPGGAPRISLIITARHTPAQIDRAAALVRLAIATLQAGRARRRDV